MSLSRSLKEALSAVERVLCANTDNLVELSIIAGVPVDRLYYKADLGGVDLRGQDIRLLLPLETRHEAAILLDSQRQEFIKFDRSRTRLAQKRENISQAEKLLLALIDRLSARKWLDIHHQESLVPRLPGILLMPIHLSNSRAEDIHPDYLPHVLERLQSWASLENLPALTDIFRTLSIIGVHPDEASVGRIHEHYAKPLGSHLCDLIAAFNPSATLDGFWLQESKSDEDLIYRVAALSKRRRIDSHAVERAFSTVRDVDRKLDFLRVARFDCDVDQAERIALHLVRESWGPQYAPAVLNLRTNAKVRNAIFRQILAQGKAERVSEMLLWLQTQGNNPGGLSIENALLGLDNFDEAYRLAMLIAPVLERSTLRIVERSLERLAISSNDAARRKSFSRRYNL